MNAPYRAVAGRIRAELQEIARVAERVTAIWRHAGPACDDYLVDAVALNLHGFYTGIERLFELIARDVDGAVPGSPHWHEELLRQMAAELPGVRPAVLTAATRERLDRYCGFRHVVRNVYTYSLDRSQVEALVQGLPATLERCTAELLAFADFLEDLAQEP